MHMEKALVSIIVPVYNVKDFFEDCINSIIAQTYRNLEIILVDDGSFDGSSDICDRYARTDGRIKVIHQKNAGAAAARKNGVDRISGYYACFVDGDDIIDCRMIEFLEKRMDGFDLVTSGCYSQLPDKEFLSRTDAFAPGDYKTKEQMEYIIGNMITFQNGFQDGVMPFLVNKMYRSDILKDVIENVDTDISYAEDRDLLFRYILRCRSIRITHASFYYYRYRSTSAMRSVNRNFMNDLNHLYISLSKAFEDHPQQNVLMHQLQLFMVSRIYQIPLYMGFDADAQIIRYIFPFFDLKEGSRVVLYGAGKVGLDYYRQILRNPRLHLNAWVDKNWNKYKNVDTPVRAVEDIWDCAYDYIIIAVSKPGLYKEISEELEERGIPKGKLLWKNPVYFNG